ncbi:hypothetical protein B5G26_13815 [Anaerotignum lactatifermentans]|uniref:CopY family transcriptional regulator n=2 Tax=Anaerotignum lactatifermentans TaxID=160404 RepID=A0A1Y3U0R1_9FIRM|nr:hypothetical protein B5G26_13815 [Anaerotignum lactatifermentans]
MEVMMKANISDSEMKVMEKIWEQGEMISVADVVTLLNEDGESWTHQTVGTFLKRLEGKGMVSASKKGKSLYYFPLLTKEQFYAKEADQFLQSKFQGSLKSFLAAFSSEKKLSDDEMQDLKDWFDGINRK